jgi:hypothetical protein
MKVNRLVSLSIDFSIRSLSVLALVVERVAIGVYDAMRLSVDRPRYGFGVILCTGGAHLVCCRVWQDGCKPAKLVRGYFCATVAIT